eukprot:188785-Alexandrium_andersonii.AAC.1
MMTSRSQQLCRLGRAAAGREVPMSSEGGGARRGTCSRTRARALASSCRCRSNHGSGHPR